MIKKLTYKNLGKLGDGEHEFYPDINLITGKNGSGKTTVMKLLWYLISGNVEWIPTEIRVSAAKVELDNCSVSYELRDNNLIDLMLTSNGKESKLLVEIKFNSRGLGRIPEGPQLDKTLDWNGLVAEATKKSLFFPTFRRIEGGFTIGKDADRYGRRSLADAVERLSDQLTVDDHKFIASISTDDVRKLLSSEDSRINTRALRLQQENFALIEAAIDSNDGEGKSGQNPEILLGKIKEMVISARKSTQKMRQPFEELASLVSTVLGHTGIDLGGDFTVGQKVGTSLDSDLLSSGEKQMLSFLCYNAFSSNLPIFIDEPEISLHTDWQRILIPTLLNQNTSNQLFLATHSPFMYSKYPNKEICLDPDRGDSGNG